MLTIKSLGKSSNSHKYYAQYAQSQGEQPGQWRISHATQDLGLAGKAVDVAVMEHLLKGFSPSGQPLCQNAGDQHRSGWDLTFSAPKSVSIVWANATEEERLKIEQAQKKAVDAGLRYIEEQCAYTRTGKGGHEQIKAELVVSTFQHSANRNREPQLHTHSIVFNVCLSDDKRWRTPETFEIYQGYRAAGEYYKAQLAREVQKLGYEIEITKDSFEVKGVPGHLIDAMSSRSQQIEDELEKLGLTRETASVELKQALNLSTRKSKSKNPVEVREFDRWQTQFADHGFDKNCQIALKKTTYCVPMALSTYQLNSMIQACTSDVTQEKSTFTKHDLHKALAKASIGVQSAKKAYHIAEKSKKTEFLIELTSTKDQKILNTRYTTPEIFALEKEMMTSISSRRDEHLHTIAKDTVDLVIKDLELKGKKLSVDQHQAVCHVMFDPAGVSLLEGVAGAGKSFTMVVVKEIYEQEGYNVFGLAPTNKAASGLEQGSGVKSCSIDSYLYKYSDGKIKLNQKNVLIVDEAAMVDSRKMAEISKIAFEKKAKVILVGDAKQIQPILAGQAFGSILRQEKASELNQVRRQINPEEAFAILKVREGKTAETLKYYNINRRLHIEPNNLKTQEKLIERWAHYQDGTKTSLIVATTNAVVHSLNLKSREYLVKKGFLQEGLELNNASGKIKISVGEKIIFTQNAKKLGILRSEIATVESISNSHIKVRKENGLEIEFNYKKFKDYTYGYAVTAHKSQGTTVDRSFVYADGYGMDREKFYVALSRGRDQNEIFVSQDALGQLKEWQLDELKKLPDGDQKEAQKSKLILEAIAENLNRSHIKDTSQDYSVPSTEQRMVLGASKNPTSIWLQFQKKLDSIKAAFLKTSKLETAVEMQDPKVKQPEKPIENEHDLEPELD